MRIKWQSCNWLLCYHQHLQKQEDSCTIIFQTTLVSVNFNAYIQKKRKRARYASFTLCFSASLNMDWQILLAPTRFFLKKNQNNSSIITSMFGHFSYDAIPLRSSPSERLMLRQEPITVDNVSKMVSYFSGACNQCPDLR